MTNSTLFSSGISVEEALRKFRSNVNRPDTIFSTESWLVPKLEQLKALLSDPISPEQAVALDDVLHQHHQMRDLIEWLECSPKVCWSDFPGFREQRQKEDDWQEWLRCGGSRPGEPHFVHGEKVLCPRCRSQHVVRVLYGLPDGPAEEAARRGALALGGCCLPPRHEVNHWCCKQCRFRWPGRYVTEDDL